MNSCNFEGRLARDAELKDVGDNKVSNFTIASDIGFGERKKTLWLECAVWGKRAESLNDTLKKGQQLFLSGEFSTREYTDKEGQNKTSLCLNVKDLWNGASPKLAEGQTLTNSTGLNDEIPF